MLAERLTYHQYLLLAFFDRVTKGEVAPVDSEIPFGDEPPPELQELLLSLLELFQIGLMREEVAEAVEAHRVVGGLLSRLGGPAISMTNPRDIRLSLTGSRLARNLGLHRVPDIDLQAIRIRLRAHLPTTTD